MEIYNEKVKDLLNPSSTGNLKIRYSFCCYLHNSYHLCNTATLTMPIFLGILFMGLLMCQYSFMKVMIPFLL